MPDHDSFQRIVPCLWLDHEAEEAATFYTGIFPDSTITSVARYPEGFDNPGDMPRGSVMAVDLELAGQPFTALNGGRRFTMDPTIPSSRRRATSRRSIASPGRWRRAAPTSWSSANTRGARGMLGCRTARVRRGR